MAITRDGKTAYKLVVGTHYARNSDFKGDSRHDPNRLIKHDKDNPVVWSEVDLTEEFPGKFVKMEEPTLPVTPASPQRKALVAQMIDTGIAEAEDRKFLEGLSEQDFARLQRMRGAVAAPASDTAKKATSSLGDDVTDQFQQAYDNGYKIWRNAAGQHQVTSGRSKKPLNPEPLQAGEVEKFVAEYMAEE